MKPNETCGLYKYTTFWQISVLGILPSSLTDLSGLKKTFQENVTLHDSNILYVTHLLPLSSQSLCGVHDEVISSMQPPPLLGASEERCVPGGGEIQNERGGAE